MLGKNNLNISAKTISRPLATLKKVATKKAIKQFAEEFNLSYLGQVNHHQADYELLAGVTADVSQQDAHYTVGSFKSHDLAIIARERTINYINLAPEDYCWTILQIDVNCNNLPHIFLDAFQHKEAFYANFFIKYPQFIDVGPFFMTHDQAFSSSFKCFANSRDIDQLQQALQPSITAMLGHHFKQFSYEIDDDKLFVYLLSDSPSTNDMCQMLRIGAWLAQQLENRQK